MKLNHLIDGAPEIEIEQLTTDSRKKCRNGLFFCIKGLMHDGHRFATMAIHNGAIAIVHSDDLAQYNPNVTYIKVKNTLKALNMIASRFYGNPSEKLTMYGITGTNGKSSIAKMIKDMVSCSTPCGYIGTIAIEYADVKLPPLLTTPDVIDIQRILHDMDRAGMKACALEVSSIGLEQHRVDAVEFDVAIFTNFTHDHLDYHGTMDNYFEA
ncbi:MAG: UDP-N-acetylmuramoyl-L-alanyl-D-glutamate--2,6-diaminopimelate ligase, partial [Erysipelotrichaceae bacterium]|nr:UDP-N-acetylmuramoyl-L-alanyl-D-glutamate--2,6-diaminopimelate ligase [Erysipelotrichaceae bacterium]